MQWPFYLKDGYVRHRGRQVRQSVYEDAKHTLSVLRDYQGSLVTSPYVVTVDGDPQVSAWLSDDSELRAPLMGEHPVTFLDYFPEGGLEAYESIAYNTLALDNGRAEPEYEYELGGLMAQDWTFAFALNANTDALAMAIFADLMDRYNGRARMPPQQELLDQLQPGDPVPEPFGAHFITLYNYAAPTPIPITRMEVESFQYARSTEEVAPGVHLFLAELVLTDFIPQGSEIGADG